MQPSSRSVVSTTLQKSCSSLCSKPGLATKLAMTVKVMAFSLDERSARLSRRSGHARLIGVAVEANDLSKTGRPQPAIDSANVSIQDLHIHWNRFQSDPQP
jgi:hypothetical protein